MRAHQIRSIPGALALLGAIALSAACTGDKPNPAGPSEPSLVFTKLAAGVDHSCGLTADGTAFCWGANQEGQLGDGSFDDRAKPVAVQTTLKFATLTAGASHTCGIVLTGGDTYCWGGQSWGRLGNGSTGAPLALPTKVIGGHVFLSIAAANVTTCGTTPDKEVYCWGLADDPTSPTSQYARPTPTLVGTGLIAAIAGAAHFCGVDAVGTGYCWGASQYGEYGDGTSGVIRTGPTAAVAGGMSFTTIRAGSNHTCGLIDSGAAYCWGRNNAGQLGDGSSATSATPVAVKGGLTFASLAAGGDHSCGVTASGAVYCWGENSDGELGDGSTEDQPQPKLVSPSLKFSVIRAGSTHTCGVTTEGESYCWGNNSHGQLGDGSVGRKLVPTPVKGE
jgi:alpha-tubulin suppressor-like RCC1 family protein